MAKEPHPLTSSVTLTVPLWLVALLPVLLMVAVLFWWDRSSSEHKELVRLEAQARRLTLELEAEKSRNEAYGTEAV